MAPPVAAAPPAAAEPVGPPSRKALQTVTEGVSVLLFFTLALVPLARFGIVPLDRASQVTLLGVAGLLLGFTPALFRASGYRTHASLAVASALRRRDERILNTLSFTSALLLILIGGLEIGAFLVFAKVIGSSSPAVVIVAGSYVLFATLSLLFLDMLLIARTSFHSRYPGRSWHDSVGYGLLSLGGLILGVSLLKNLNLLSFGFFAGIRPEQSPYLLTLGIFLQFIAFRLLLRYPPLARVFQSELELVRKAHRDERVQLERKALRTYLAGMAFFLVSIFFMGGLATGQVAVGNARTTTYIVIGYVLLGLAILSLLLIRYLQHQHIQNLARRQESGDVVPKKRMSPEQVAALTVNSISGLFAALFVILAFAVGLQKTPLDDDFYTDFLILAFLVGVGPIGFRRAIQMRRIHAMDEKFPEFLRDMAEGLRAGMTLPRALFSASKGVYGALTPQIKLMSAQVEWGVSFTEALQRFSERVRTPLIQRTVSLINEASKAGGSVVDILTAASSDAREIKQILEDRRRQMGIYSVIIYVAFVVFLVVIYVLAAQFLPSFETAVKSASGTQVGGLNFQSFSVEAYTRIFFHGALIQGIGSGLVAGVMSEGHPLGGLKHSFIMTLIAWAFFRLLL